MSKEQFQRTKPHLAQTTARLQQIGVSGMGAQQVLRGQPVSNPRDRELLAKLISSMAIDMFLKLDGTGFEG